MNSVDSAALRVPAKSLRILLVEDSQDDMDLIAAELRAAGIDADVRRVDTAPALSAALAAGGWDAVISDYHVPGIGSGAGGALALVAQAAYDGPLIVVSGVIGEENAVALMKAGASDFVMKTRLARLGPSLLREVGEAALRREHALAQSALKVSEQRLRELTESMRLVREDEQARIARELHDELGQVLTALQLELSWVGSRVTDGQADIRRRLDAMRKMVAAAVEDVRRIAGDLRPAALDELGLAAAIDWQLKKFRDLTGAAIELNLSHEEFAIGERIAVAAFRVVQESLTNAARHAQASKVSVTAGHAADRLTIEIRDDGKGIPAAVLAGHGVPGGNGLLGMRERVQQLGGTFDVDSAPGEGTVLRASIPCSLAAGSPYT
jgi:signal transduction histidine kinase